MLKTLVLVCILTGIAFLFLSIQLLIKKNGKFPNTHIEDNEHLKKYGITCAANDTNDSCDKKTVGSNCEACSVNCSIKQID